MKISHSNTYDVVSFLKDNGIEFVERGKNVGRNDVNVKCFNCDDPSYHLSIHKHSGVWHCWRCSVRGNFIGLIKQLLNVSLSKAISIAKKYSDNDFVVEEHNGRKLQFPDNCFPLLEPRNDEHELYRKLAVEYLVSRYVNPYDKFDWKFTPRTDDMYSYLVIIPLYFNYEVVSWIGRRYIPTIKPKYVNAPKEKSVMTTKQILFNYDNYTEDDFIFLTEGIFDALRFGRLGISTFGKIVSNEQINLLTIKRPKKIFYVPDKDVKQNEINQMVNILSLITDITTLFVPEKFKDVGSMKKTDVLLWLNEVLSETEFREFCNKTGFCLDKVK